jgi:predicted nucleic-acid-binding Zn-ribbon protein
LIPTVTFVCLDCGIKEKIPKDVVDILDGSDLGYSPDKAPQFSCEKCGGQMYPEDYTNMLGYHFSLKDKM